MLTLSVLVSFFNSMHFSFDTKGVYRKKGPGQPIRLKVLAGIVFQLPPYMRTVQGIPAPVLADFAIKQPLQM